MYIEACVNSSKEFKVNKFSLDGVAYQEKYVKEGETFEDVGKAWLQVHLLLGENKNTQDVS